MISRRQYNYRRKLLSEKAEGIRKAMAETINSQADVFAIDSMLLDFEKSKERIETVFYQLCDQFMMQHNYAKSFTGLKFRILAKVTGLTVLQFLNKFINNKPVGRVKHTLVD